MRHTLQVVLGFAIISTAAFAVSFQKAGPMTGVDPHGFELDDSPCLVTDVNGHWVAVWSATKQGGFGTIVDSNIAFSRSSDNGKTWTTPDWVNSTANDPPVQGSYVFEGQPSLATDGNGTWVCAYIGGEIKQVNGLYSALKQIQTCISTDNGQTWGDPVTVNPDDPVSYSLGAPSIAADGNGSWMLVWESSALANNPAIDDSDIVYSTSADGETWSDYQMLNSEGATDSSTTGSLDIDPVVASDGNGVWVCAWNSDFKRGLQGQGDREIFFARSTNNGGTWTSEAVLNSEFDTETGLDERPTILTDGSGNWIIAWDGYTDLSSRYRIWTSSSSDGGQSWSQRVQVSENPPQYDQTFPALATDNNGKWIIVWQGKLALSPSSDDDIGYAESTNNGGSWGTVKAVNSDAADDSLRDDVAPSIAGDGTGHWVVLWRTTDPQNGDYDIWQALSKESGGGSGSLTLTVPNGGEKWKIGKKKSIEWTSSGNVGTNVKIELLKGGSVVKTINGSTPNDGKQKWKIPNTVTPGKGFKVRVTDTSNASISDTSDGSFKIK